jgi:endonuclease/exonuclease/phosphatase family metal-dependent hydrolase
MLNKNLTLITFFVLIIIFSACQTKPTEPPIPIPTTEPSTGIEFLEKDSPDHLRVMSYNVNWDSIFPDSDPLNDTFREYDKSEAFHRILKAVNPDILCLQEVNPARDPQQVGDILDELLPLEGGMMWQVHSGSDNLIAARYDLQMEDAQIAYGSKLAGRGHAMALVDLPDAGYVSDLYLICAHYKSQGGQSNINARQAHADATVAWIRDLKTTGGEIDLPPNTPFMVLGDLNVYDTDPAQHLTTLLGGDIENEKKYGEDTTPDWDNTDLADALPSHNGLGSETYTWRDDTQEFNPGVLDHILYTDSLIQLESGFVLNTMSLSEDALAAAGLQAGDVALDPAAGDFDHLPMVVDISISDFQSE